MTEEEEAVEEIAQGVRELLVKADRCGAVDPRDFKQLVRLLNLVAQNTISAFYFGVASINTNDGSAAATKTEDTFTIKGSDGIHVSAAGKDIVVSGKVTPFTEFKFIHKGFENNNLKDHEIGDIFCGWSNDGKYRYTEAKWTGGPLSDSNNFIPLVLTEV